MKYIVSFAIWASPLILVLALAFWLAPDTTRDLLGSIVDWGGRGDEIVRDVSR